MNSNKRTFFLGANTPKGFFSLYDKFISSSPGFFYFIKGGPGCGKSSFMRRIADKAEEKGLECEYILCSADPDSLDGIWLPELKTGLLDATAPHVTEPKITGITGAYINLGAFYDLASLKKSSTDIASLHSAYKSEYSEAYRRLFAASTIEPREVFKPNEVSVAAVLKREKGIFSREIRNKKGAVPNTSLRFIDAVTAEGRKCLYDSVAALADRIYIIDNDLGLAPVFLKKLSEDAENCGNDTIRCLSPEDPSRIVHLILPELRLGFISRSSLPCSLNTYRHLRLDAYVEKEFINRTEQYRLYKKMYNNLFDDAVSHLNRAKKLHDEMEKLYNPCVDFDGVYSLAEKYADVIL